MYTFLYIYIYIYINTFKFISRFQHNVFRMGACLFMTGVVIRNIKRMWNR